MSKGKVIKAARNLISKDGYTHQEAYEEIRQNSDLPAETIASLVSRVPSQAAIAKVAVWRMIYIIMMALVVILRIISIIAMGELSHMNNGIMLVLLIISMLVPILAIMAAIQHNYEGLKLVSILLILSIIRSLKDFEADWFMIIPLIPFAGAIILGFALGPLTKAGYREVLQEYTTEDGKMRKRREYVFEEQKSSGKNDILDI